MRQAIRFFGVPLAVIVSIGTHGSAFGLSISSFLDPMFAFVLVVNLLIIGLGGGAVFGLLMWWMVQRLTGSD